MGAGMLGYAAVGINSSFGTDSVAVADYIAITGETFTTAPNPIFSQGITAKWDEQKAYNGLQTVQGNVSGEVHPATIGYLLRSALDATSTAIASGAPWCNEFTSDAAWRCHRFIAAQTQFQSGSGSDLPTLTWEIYRGPSVGASSAFVYYGTAANVLELSVEAGQLTRFSADFLGREYGGKAATTPSFATPEAFLWSQASVSLGGAGSAFFESFTIRVNNNLEAVPVLDGRLRPDLIKRNDFRRIEVSGSVSFRSTTEYDRFLAGSEFPVKILFTAQNSMRLKLDMPAVRYTSFNGPNLNGPGRISIPFQGRAMWHAGSATALDVVLVNTRVSPFTVNTNA